MVSAQKESTWTQVDSKCLPSGLVGQIEVEKETGGLSQVDVVTEQSLGGGHTHDISVDKK